MLVCHCHSVNDAAIRTAIAAGAYGTDELASFCGAGGACGGCVPVLEALLDEVAPTLRVADCASAPAA